MNVTVWQLLDCHWPSSCDVACGLSPPVPRLVPITLSVEISAFSMVHTPVYSGIILPKVASVELLGLALWNPVAFADLS